MTKTVNCYNDQFRKKSNGRMLNLKIFNFFVFLFVFSFGFAYLIGISDLTVKGFVLQELKSESANLIAEKFDNQQKIDDVQSYYALNLKAQTLDMVAIDDIEYLFASNHVVAKK